MGADRARASGPTPLPSEKRRAVMNYLTPRNGKTDDIMSPLLSLRRAAKYVGLGLSTFYEKMKKGEVDKVTFDGRTFTTIRSLDAYISRNTQPAKIEAKTEPPPR